MRRNLIVLVVVFGLAASFVVVARFFTGTVVPPVDGYLEGQPVRFIHTEASDPEVAALLTRMKGSPVLIVPALAQAPKEMLGNVYVFTNGVPGDGPFEYQNDIFDHAPGSPGYRPLRMLNLVKWKDGHTPRLLMAAAEVEVALAKGEIVVEQPGVVINMPLVTWPGGHR